MKTSAVTVDETVYCVTMILLHQLIAQQLCRELTASKKNYVEMNVISHQKSKFLNTVVCGLVTQCSKQYKEFRVTQNRGHGPWSFRSDGTAASCIAPTSFPSSRPGVANLFSPCAKIFRHTNIHFKMRHTNIHFFSLLTNV